MTVAPAETVPGRAPAAGPVGWLLAPAPSQRLAVFRILAGTYAVVWSLIRLPAHLAHANQPASRWQPVGVLAPFGDPLPAAVVALLAVGTPLVGLLFVAGYRFRVMGPVFAVALLLVTTLDSSFGQIFHTENLVVLHVAILAAAPAAADALAVGRRRPVPGAHARYGWPLRLAALVVVVAYVIAGIAKLRIGGTGWVTGDVLRNLVAHDNLRKAVLGDAHSPVGAALVRFGWLFPPLAVASLAVELGAAAALLGRVWRTVWVVSAWVFHVAVLALMAVLFPYQLSGVAFAPFFRLERLPTRVRHAMRARQAKAAASPRRGTASVRTRETEHR